MAAVKAAKTAMRTVIATVTATENPILTVRADSRAKRDRATRAKGRSKVTTITESPAITMPAVTVEATRDAVETSARMSLPSTIPCVLHLKRTNVSRKREWHLGNKLT